MRELRLIGIRRWRHHEIESATESGPESVDEIESAETRSTESGPGSVDEIESAGQGCADARKAR